MSEVHCWGDSDSVSLFTHSFVVKRIQPFMYKKICVFMKILEAEVFSVIWT